MQHWVITTHALPPRPCGNSFPSKRIIRFASGALSCRLQTNCLELPDNTLIKPTSAYAEGVLGYTPGVRKTTRTPGYYPSTARPCYIYASYAQNCAGLLSDSVFRLQQYFCSSDGPPTRRRRARRLQLRSGCRICRRLLLGN